MNPAERSFSLSLTLSILIALALGGPAPSLADGGLRVRTEPLAAEAGSTGATARYLEERSHVAVVEVEGAYDRRVGGVLNLGPRTLVAREIYGHHPDDYDFLVAFSSFEFDTGDAVAFHVGVRNDVQGIGLPLFDDSALFGSDGRLQGYVDMGALGRYTTDPLDPGFERSLAILAHEILHQWGAYVRFRRPDGTLSDALLGRDGSHWSYLLDSDASVLYGNDWQDAGDGTFTSRGVETFFSPLDLYLAGFFGPDEVPPFVLIDNPAVDPAQLPRRGAEVTGDPVLVTIDDVIAAEGPRVPSADEAPKELRAAFVFLVRPGEQVSERQIQALERLRAGLLDRFGALTGGRAILEVFPAALPAGEPGAPGEISGGPVRDTEASLADGLTWLRSRQAQEGFWEDRSGTRLRDTVTALSTLLTLDPAFTGEPAALGWLSGRGEATTDSIARKLAALSGRGLDPAAERSALFDLQNPDGGWGLGRGYGSDAMDTALAVAALAGTGDPGDSAWAAGAELLVALQNADGGWSATAGGPSRTGVTAAVLRALDATDRIAEVATGAAAFLAGKQNPDGGFGDSPSTVHDTADALQGLIAAGGLGAADAPAALAYLGARQTVDGSWAGSVYATALAVDTLRRGRFPNWRFTAAPLAEPSAPRDGERVRLTFTVANDGSLETPAGVLRLFEGDPDGGGTPAGADLADLEIPPLAPGGAVTLSRFWDSLDRPGENRLVALLDPDGALEELSELDNRAELTVQVAPAPDGAELEITSDDLTVSPPYPTELPADLAVSASVRNLGKTDVAAVLVELVAGADGAGAGQVVDQQTVAIPQRAATPVHFAFTLTAPGTTLLTVRVDPANDVAEADEANNSASASVTTQAAVDLVVAPADLAVDGTPTLGSDVTLRALLRNRGTVDAPEAAVRFTVTDGTTTRDLAVAPVLLPAGGSAERSALWRVDLTGDLVFSVSIDEGDAVAETDETNNRASFDLAAGVVTEPNLSVAYQDLTFTPDPGLEGSPVELAALVRNTGGSAASDVEVGFYEGDPDQGGRLLGALRTIPTLAAGEGTTVSITLPALEGAGDRLIVVVADPADRLVEFTEEDNRAFRTLQVLALLDLAVSPSAVESVPALPEPGTPVTTTVTVANHGEQEARNVTVRLTGDGVPLGPDQTLPTLAAGSSGSVTFTWSFPEAASAVLLSATVDPGNLIAEGSEANNRADREIAAFDAGRAVSNPYFSPNGDGVRDTTVYSFTLAAPTAVTVQVLDARNRVMRSEAGAAFQGVTRGRFEWDGRDDAGQVVPDGDYLFAVVVGADASVQRLDDAPVTVDTDRWPLFEALGTRFERVANLSCNLPGVSQLGLVETEDLAYFQATAGYGFDSSTDGVYRVPVTSGKFERIVDKLRPGQLAFSSDGEKVVTDNTIWSGGTLSPLGIEGAISREFLPSTQDLLWVKNSYYSTPYQFRLTPLDGTGPERLITEVSSRPRWNLSPDGRTLLLNCGTAGSFVEVDSGASHPMQMPDGRHCFSRADVWSPDGLRLAVTIDPVWDPEIGWKENIVVFDRDGTLVRFIEAPLDPFGTISAYPQSEGIPTDIDFWDVEMSVPTWGDSGEELVYVVQYRENGFGPGGSHYGVHFGRVIRINVVTGAQQTVAWIEPQIFIYSYHVETWDGSRWVERGELHYGLHYSENRLDLSAHLPDADGEYKVRIRQVGREAAHVDQVALELETEEGEVELRPAAAHLGSGQDVTGLVRVLDRDVADLHERAVVVRWDDPGSTPYRAVFTMVAREEDLSTRQARSFRYPSADRGSYHYLVGSRPGMEVDGAQTGADRLDEPIFAEWSGPDTGHPAATVYGYVGDDGEALHAALDFTVDNTEDGDRDWAALWVDTPEGWREFRVTAADRRWGEVSLTRTGRVHHGHKYYEFRIPFTELGLRAGETAAVRFEAYGTAAVLDGAGTFLPQDGWYPVWVPGADRILYAPNGSDTVWLVDATGETPPERVLEGFNTFSDARFGAAGRTLLFEDGRDALDPQHECYDPDVSRSTYALTSLANDAVALDAGPTPDGRGVALSGTATDLHFSRWLLEYASEEIPDFWTPVLPPVGTPAVDEELATWIPPGPGAYLVRLTVEDLAGNRRSVVRRLASPSASAVSITDLSVAPRYISPDGDDVQDAATVRYRVLAPVHLEIAVIDAQGERVRTFIRDHSVVGTEHQVIWDGRDDSGLPVPDGRYQVEAQGYRFTVTVDTTAPEVRGFELEGPGVVRNTLERGAVFDLGPRAVWCVRDEHPAGGKLQTGQGSAPAVWKRLGEAEVGTTCSLGRDEWPGRALTLAQLTGNSFRLEVGDLAGNVTRRTVGPAAGELALYRFRAHPDGASGEMLFPEHAVPADGGVLLDGTPPVRMRLAETAAAQVARVVVQVQLVDAACPLPPCTGEWLELDPVSVHAPGEVAPAVGVPDGVLDLVWDSSILDPGASYRLRLRARTVGGADLFSNTLTLRFTTDGIRYLGVLRADTEPPTDDPAATRSQLDLALGRSGLRPAETTVLWALETIEDTLSDVGLVVTSEDDPRYAGGKVLPLAGEAGGVLVFDGSDLLPCKTYGGRVVARALPAAGGDPRPVESSPVETPLPCLVLEARLDAPPLAACGETPDPGRSVTLTPRSLDGVPLQLMTLAVDDPENIVRSVNRPLADTETTFDLGVETLGLLEEGIHTLYASLTNGEGDVSGRRLALAVDRSAPRVEITYPTDGQRLCGAPDVSGRRVVTLEGLASDFGVPGDVPARFEIERPDGSWGGEGQLPRPTATLPTAGPFQALESVSTPVTHDLADVAGSVRARLVAADAGGHRVCTAPIDFFFDGAVEGFSTSVGPTLISPDGDGMADSVQVSFVSAEATAVDVTIHSGTERELFGVVSVEPVGPALRTLAAGLATAGAGSVVWDGLGEGGAPVPDGLYAIVVQATDGCGNTARSVRGVRVDTRPPTVQILSPGSGDGLPLIVEVVGTATDPNFATFTLEHGVGAAPFTWSLLAGGDRPVSADRLGPWNTYGLAGEQTLRLTATDLAGNSASTIVTLTLPASDSLVTALEVVPEAFSPNGDGSLDGASVRFGFAQEVQADLQVVAADGTPVRTLAVGEAFPAGAALLTWDGRNDAGQVVVDGRYGVRLRATAAADPSLAQDEQVPVTVDTAAPAIELTRPRDGFAPGTASVTGRILDPRLDAWVVELTDTPDLPDWQVIGEGDGRIGAASSDNELGSWEGLAEGPHAVRVRATDRAGNRADRIVPFEVDDTAPEVELTAPESGSVVGAVLGPVPVQGSAAEEHPRGWRLELGAGGLGDEPASWTLLATGDGLPPAGTLLDWVPRSVPDGLYSLRLLAEDLGGLTGEARVPIAIDNSPPAAAITTPAADAWVTGPTTVSGTAWDPNLLQLRLEVAPAGTARWSEVGRSTAAVQSGPLFSWRALPPDGAYRLRLVVEDRAANRTVTEIPVRIDTRPPAVPEGLAASLAEDGGSVTLTWQANREADLAGYAVERDGVRLTPVPAGSQPPSYVDTLAGDGTFRYTVRAVDRAGLESGPSATAEVVRDTTPPGVVLHRPQPGDRVSGLVDVRVTAASSDFAEYRVWAGPADGSAPLELLRRSPTPARSEVVAQWNAASLSRGGGYRFRLEAEDVRGNVGVAEAVVEVDNLPPAAPTGLTATATGADVALAWSASTEPDLAGYLVYRDGELIHGVGDDLVLRALRDPAYTDTGLPDGELSYRVIAIDRAGNLSPASAPATATIDQRAPHAEIVRPEPGTRFDAPVYVLAALDDRDVAQVRFEQRPVGGGWSEVALVTAAPWETTWNPAGLDYGDYELRAVATDDGGKVDPAPVAVPVIYTDLERPAPVTGLAVRVYGDSVRLSWSPGAEPDLAGYLIDRVPENGSPVRVTASPVPGTSFVDFGVPDDRYVYRVVAVDVYDNESFDAATADALVYTPTLEQPWTPTARRSVALGGQTLPGTSVQVEVVRPDGTETLPPVPTDGEGRFRVDGLALGVGVNELAAVASDASGNRSKRAAVAVVVGEPPSPPTGLAATVTDRTVDLSWTPSPEADVLGYRVFLDGAPLHPDGPQTGLTATASSQASYYVSPYRAIDRNPSTYWAPAAYLGLEGQWLQATWAEPSSVLRLSVSFYDVAYRAADYDLQILDGGSWRTLFEVRGSGEASTTFELPEPYPTTGVRILFHEVEGSGITADTVLLSGLSIFSRPLTLEPAALFDTGDGVHEVAVSAVDRTGFESAPSAPLELAVGDVEPPAPVSLAGALEGADAVLTWTASPATDLDYYGIFRDGEQVGYALDLASRTYREAGLANGTYRYTVRPFDLAGNAGEPSNEVVLTVDSPLPGAPTALSVVDPGVGDLLELSWNAPAAGAAAVAYVVERSTTPGGPYVTVAETAATRWSDRGLTTGTTYYYLVRARDALGNVGPPSAEASATPFDRTGPRTSIHYPGAPGVPYVTSTAVLPFVAGSTEPGAEVTVRRDGSPVGVATATSATTVDSPGEIIYGLPRVAPDGNRTVLDDYYSHYLIDFSTGEVSELIGVGQSSTVWFPDGERLLVGRYDYTVGAAVLEAYRPSDQSFEQLAVVGSVEVAVPSPDGRRAAVIGAHDSFSGLFVIDLATGETTDLVADQSYRFDEESLTWSPDGAHVAYGHRVSDWQVEVAGVDGGDTGEVTVVEAVTRGWDYSSWSPSGDALVYSAYRSGWYELWIYRLDTASAEPVAAGDVDHLVPQWSPDGTKIAFVRDWEALDLLDLASGQVEPLHDFVSWWSSLVWSPSGRLVTIDDGIPVRITPAGRFEVADVPLLLGDNTFTALGTDGAGNVGDPSAPMVVTLAADEQPNLEIAAADLTVLPAVPLAGQAVTLSATVRSTGVAEAPASSLSLVLVEPNGAVQPLAEVAVDALAPGTSRTVTETATLGTEPGRWRLVATADPLGRVFEADEDDNRAELSFLVPADGTPVVAVETGRTEVGPDEELAITVELANAGPDFAGALEVSIEDGAGYPVESLPPVAVPDLASGSRQVQTLSWNSGQVFAGEYVVIARLADGSGATVGEASSSFTLTATASLEASVVTERSLYEVGETARLVGTVRYLEGNGPLAGASTRLVVLDGEGQVAAEWLQPLGELLPGAEATVGADWPSAGAAPGSYRARIEVLRGGSPAAAAESPFELAAPNLGLLGSLGLSENAPPVGAPVTATFEVTNGTPEPLTGLPVEIVVTRPADGTAVLSESLTVDLAPGEVTGGEVVLATDSLGLDEYLVLLRAGLPGATEPATLAAVALTPVDGTPPEIRSVEPADGSELASTSTTVRVVAFDPLSGIDRVEVAVDGGASTAATFASPADGLWTRELTGLAQGAHALEVRAVDGAGNEALRTVAFTVSAGEPELLATQTATLAFDADGDGVPSPGDEIAYEVVISNTGGGEATGVVLTEPVPAHTTLVAGSVETTAGTVVAPDPTGPEVTVDLGTLGAGESATVRFRVAVDLPVPAGVDRVEAQGVVTSVELPALFTDDPTPGGDADPTVTMITAAPELLAEKTAALVADPDGDGVPSPGDTLEYTVTMRNTGNTSATAVGLADPVPEHTTLVAGSARVGDGSGPSSGTGSVTGVITEGDPLLVDLGEVPGRSSVEVTFRVVIDLPIAAGVREVSNQGLVVSAELPDVVTDDPAVDGAADPTVTPVSAAPVLLVEKTDALFQDLDGDGLASPGDELLYRITVGNTGNIAATALTLVDPVPENTVLVADTVQVAGGALVFEEPITVEADLLPVGDELVVSFRVRIVESFPLDVLAVANGAEVTGAEPELVDPIGSVPSDDPDTLEPGDPTVTEVFITPEITVTGRSFEEHQGPAVFRFTLSEPSNRPVTVDWTTRDAGATAGFDYRAAFGRLTVGPGETEATVVVELIDDALDELDEGIALVLSDPVGGELAQPEALATIVDDDSPPFVSVADVEVLEGDGPGAEAVFTIALSAPSGLGVQVGYATADGTAEAGSDYQATSGTVLIPAGLVAALVRVPIVGDLVDERDETFTLTLTDVINAIDPTGGPTGGSTGGRAARATILDDDTAWISIDDLRVDEDGGNGGTTDALFPVRLSTEADREITVSFVAEESLSAAHPATAGADFTPVTGTVVFAAGETERAAAVPIVGDLLLEADEETFTVRLFDPTETEIEDGLAIGTIVDDELCPGPNLLANPGAEERLVATETGDELPGWLEVEGTEWTRRLAPPEPFEGEASFGAGTVQTGELAQDADLAAYEVRIDGAGGQRFAFSGRVRTFDEVPPDTARIVVEYRDRSNSIVLSAFDSGEIASPFEWREVTDVRTAPAGTGWVRVRLIADRFTDGTTDAYFDALSLRSLRAPVLTVSDTMVVEGDGEPVDALFRITLSCPFDRAVTAHYATADESALAGFDYTPVEGELDLPSGATETKVAVPVLGDEVHELHETFRLELSEAGPAGQVVSLDPVGVGLILNDDFCARSHGFWKTHGELWPTDWLSIGGVEYGVADLQAFLEAKGGDATLHLVRELVAAKLNLLVGSDPGIVPTIEDADAYLAAFPPGSDPKSGDRQLAEGLKDSLEAYNNPRCEETPVIP